jgi:hypothetical protein
MIISIAVSVDTDGNSPGSDMRCLKFRRVAPRCVKHSTLGIFMFAANPNASESAWNIRGSDNAPRKTSSRPSKKILPASPTQNTGSPAERALSNRNQNGVPTGVRTEALTMRH